MWLTRLRALPNYISALQSGPLVATVAKKKGKNVHVNDSARSHSEKNWEAMSPKPPFQASLVLLFAPRSSTASSHAKTSHWLIQQTGTPALGARGKASLLLFNPCQSQVPGFASKFARNRSRARSTSGATPVRFSTRALVDDLAPIGCSGRSRMSFAVVDRGRDRDASRAAKGFRAKLAMGGHKLRDKLVSKSSRQQIGSPACWIWWRPTPQG